MKLGFSTAYLPETRIEDLIRWASHNKFQMLEIPCWPTDSRERDYAVTHIDIDAVSRARIEELKETLRRYNIGISCLAYSSNNLHPDPKVREKVNVHLRKLIKFAHLLNVRVVQTFVGKDPWKTVDENFKIFVNTFPDIVRLSEDHGTYLAIENCPMVVEHGGMQCWPTGANLAYSPEIWARMFEAIPSRSFGLTLDPSHLIWQGIDYVKTVRVFKDRIFHVHAKDTKIDRDVLSRVGIFGTGWWINKLPGLGDINWAEFISALYEVGYDYAFTIEGEDKAWETSTTRKKEGLLLARDILSSYIR